MFYGETDWEKNHLLDDIRDFIKEHSISELMEVVTDAIKICEEE